YDEDKLRWGKYNYFLWRGAQNVTSGDGYGDVEELAVQCPRKVVKCAAFLKLFMFALFMLLSQVSHESTNRGVMRGTPQLAQAIVHKSANRLLAEPPMDFD
ncbi:Pv-fam-h protein, partial [Plasmodium cynomolgi strain B]